MFSLIWIFCLSLVAVSYQFFAPGLGGDSPLYAGVARSMIESGEFFVMRSGLPEFQPFAEHPHLGFWITALFFKVFGVHDWSYRLVGQLFYFGSLAVIWRLVARDQGRERAHLAVLLLWIWPLFAKFFANAYLDAGFIFFALCSYEVWSSSRSRARVLIAGGALGAALLYKGTVGLALLPIFALAAWRAGRLRDLVWLASSALGVLGIYLAILAVNDQLVFVSQYLASVSRRGSVYSLKYFFESRPYVSLIKETFGLVLLLPVVAWFGKEKTRRTDIFAAAWVGVFAVAYVATGRRGAQYWATLMPCLAWMLVACVPDQRLRIVPSLRNFSFVVALVLLPLSQLWPRPIRWRPDPFLDAIAALQQEKSFQALWIDKGIKIVEDFSNSGRLIWYARIPEARYVQPQDGAPAPDDRTALVLMIRDTSLLKARKKQLVALDWCEQPVAGESMFSLWLACPTP